ncbi:MAG: RES domain-containing protein [Flavobacteriales bacterium]|nr:RES domain-containing protein [Flavobacteriales bacterium]
MTSTAEFESRFPSLSHMRGAIAELESCDLSTIPWEELEEMINDAFGIVIFSKHILPAGSRLYRARRNGPTGAWTSLKDIHVRESDAITTYGRAHRPSQRVFYCSENSDLATFEHLQHLKLQLFPEHEVAQLTIGEWVTTAPLHLASITHSGVLHEFREDIRARHDSINATLDQSILSKDTIEKQKLMLQFFANQFTKANILHNHDYKLSALYSNRIMEANSLLRGPSVSGTLRRDTLSECGNALSR